MISTETQITKITHNEPANDAIQSHQANALAPILASRRRRRVALSEDELKGLHHIIANPEPPTQELIKACEEYADFASDHPNSNW